MPLSSSERRKAPKSLAFIALLGLLLIAAVAFIPNSSAGLQSSRSVNSSGGGSGSKRSRPEFVPGEALVRFKSGRAFEGSTYMPVPNELVQQKIDGIQGSAAQEQILVQVDRFDGSDLVDGLRIAHAADTGKAIAALRARDDVIYAEPNYIRHPINTPNDPSFSSLYGLTKIGAPTAWNTTTGSSNIVVGVIDEGIDITHPDLAANIWTNPAPGSISGISGDLHGYDFINNSGTIPPEGHATHVAGTIGAVGNNGVGVVGVNWTVRLMSLRFIDQVTNNGSTADAIRAYNYAKQMRDLWVSSSGASGANIRALNASYGGGGFSKAEQDALTALGNSGILFAAAAGNDARNTDAAPNYPSGYNLTNMISVAATDSNDNLAGFSNFGVKSVLMGAPGVGILSTTPANTYSVFSGTSMAAPHVAGAAALVSAANQSLSVNQLRALLAFNGDIVPSLQTTTLTKRRLNVANSLQALNENDTTPPGSVGSFQVTSQSGRTFNLSWIASGDDAASGTASLYDISFIDQSSGSVIPLTTIAPAASGSTQTLSVNVPYRHTGGTIRLREFDNVGNEGTPVTLPVTIDPFDADPYIANTTSTASLSTGGAGLGFNCDDCFKTRALPFSFRYFGTYYCSVKISSNGNIYFEPPTAPTRGNGDADDVPSSVDGLSPYRMIAGMWDDLDLRRSRRSDADVYLVQPDASRITFRWQGVQYGDGINGDPINFEIELNSDGTIKTRYGSGNTNLLPIVGISGGEPDAYVITSLTSEANPVSLTNAAGATFVPRTVITIDTPTIAPTNISEGSGATVNVNGTFSDPSGTLDQPFTAVVNWGDCTTSTAMVSGSGNPFTYSFNGAHTFTQSGLGVTVSAINKDGRVSTSAVANLTVANIAPTVSSLTVNPTGANEGANTVFSLNGSFTDPAGALDQPFTAVVNWGDSTTSIATVTGSGNPFIYSFNGTHTYAQSGSFNVTVSVTDKDGGTGMSTPSNVTIANVAPTVSSLTVSPMGANEGASTVFSISGSFTDPAGALDQPFTAVVNWGDNTTSAATVTGGGNPFSYSFNGTHSYAQNGLYSIIVSVTDKDGGTGTSTTSNVTIANVAPAVGTPAVSPVIVGQGLSTSFSVNGTFTDPASALDQPFTAVVNWGDSTTSTATVSGSNNPFSYSFNGTHTYAQSGSFNVTVSVTDKDGGASTSAAGSVSVRPTIQFSSATYTVSEGSPRVDITLTRSGDSTSSAAVNYATNDAAGLTNCNVFNGIASPRCDYENTIGTLSFAAGETSKSFSIAIIDDSYAEGSETFTVGLNNPGGATLGTQSTATVTIIDNDSTNGTNPIDSTNFFVRQQYIDFLGREPDPPGFAGWTSTINNCTGDTTQCDRIHVSQLFFQSEEFQSRGYFVFRFYPVAFGRKPDYAEFVPDLARVSGFLDNNQLEAAKVAFIADFMARTAFVNTYNGLTNQQYVDALLNAAGVTLASRQSLIDGLNNSTMTRAQVLRQIVESTEVSTKYNHQAYAVMEYFGYLRRQPDAFYLDWIAVLDQSNDPRGMVTGFVNSAEYRQRFGP